MSPSNEELLQEALNLGERELASLAGALIERHPGYRLQHRGGVTEWSE